MVRESFGLICALVCAHMCAVFFLWCWEWGVCVCRLVCGVIYVFKFQFAFVYDWVKIFQFYALQPLTLVYGAH